MVDECLFFSGKRALIVVGRTIADLDARAPQEATGVTLLGGLTGAAAEYVSTLDMSGPLDFDTLSLTRKFGGVS